MASHELHADPATSGQPGSRPAATTAGTPTSRRSAGHPGDDVVVTTRDAVDGQLTMDSTHEDLLRTDRTLVYLLTGPIFVDGAEPGDLLVVDILDVRTGPLDTRPSFPASGS